MQVPIRAIAHAKDREHHAQKQDRMALPQMSASLQTVEYGEQQGSAIDSEIRPEFIVFLANLACVGSDPARHARGLRTLQRLLEEHYGRSKRPTMALGVQFQFWQSGTADLLMPGTIHSPVPAGHAPLQVQTAVPPQNNCSEIALRVPLGREILLMSSGTAATPSQIGRAHV